MFELSDSHLGSHSALCLKRLKVLKVVNPQSVNNAGAMLRAKVLSGPRHLEAVSWGV